MTSHTKIDNPRVAVLGLGAMGRALAEQLIMTGHSVTVWNRTPGRAADLSADGVSVADTPTDAIIDSELIIVCLLDAASVREVLAGTEAALHRRVVINLTTTSPDQARDLAAEIGGTGVDYIGGAVMATPELIGGEHASLLYSGDHDAFERHRGLLTALGRSHWLGGDPGAAAMYDLAILGGMYAMFAAFDDGARMVRSAGGTASELAGLMAPFLQAMTASFDDHGRGIDTPESYESVQSEDFTAAAIDLIATAARSAELDPQLMQAARRVLAPGSI